MEILEHLGPCPCIAPSSISDNRVIGLLSLVIHNMVYTCDGLTVANCNQAFSSDPIAYRLLSAIVLRFTQRDTQKIWIHRLINGGINTQSTSDIQQILKESENPEIVVETGSNFVAVVSDDSSSTIDLNVYLWDLRECK